MNIMFIKKTMKNIYACAAPGLLMLSLASAPLVLDKAFSQAGVDVNLSTHASAQAAAQRKPRRLPGISQKTNEQLNKIAELISPTVEEGKQAKKPNLNAAQRQLVALEKRCTKTDKAGKMECNGNELGNIYRFFGVLYFEKDDLANTAKYFEKLVAQAPNIPYVLEETMLLQLAKIYGSLEDYKKALRYLDKYMKVVPVVPADAFYTKSTICYQNDDIKCALKSINTAVKMVESGGNVAKEPWYNLQRGIYNQNEDYKNSLSANLKLMKHYPKASYWNDIGTFYALLEKTEKTMHVYNASLAAGILDTENQYLQLAQLFYQEDAPYDAAKVLEKGIKAKVVKATERNLEKLGRYFFGAKEYKDAIKYLSQAAAKSDTGDIYSDVAGIYVQIEDLQNAISAAQKAFKKGKLKSPGRLHYQVGSAYFELKQYDKAIAAFEKSAKDKSTKKIAEQWRDYAIKQKDRYERLEKFINS